MPKQKKIEDTKEVVEITDQYIGDKKQLNEYIRLGWRLINHYVTNHGDGPGVRDEMMHYVLAWQEDGEPPVPPESASDF